MWMELLFIKILPKLIFPTEAGHINCFDLQKKCGFAVEPTPKVSSTERHWHLLKCFWIGFSSLPSSAFLI